MPRLQSPDCLLNAFIFKEWEFVSATRKYLSDLILGIYKDKKDNQFYAEKLATASSELIENAYKYSPQETDFQIVLQKSEHEILLQVRNYVQGDPGATVATIQKEIELVYGDPDPREAFKKKVLASLSDPNGKSMLGYAKIRLETGGLISAELEDDGLLLISVVFPLAPSNR
jgi:hypothetical protein